VHVANAYSDADAGDADAYTYCDGHGYSVSYTDAYAQSNTEAAPNSASSADALRE
jgi:hypothetical protein